MDAHGALGLVMPPYRGAIWRFSDGRVRMDINGTSTFALMFVPWPLRGAIWRFSDGHANRMAVHGTLGLVLVPLEGVI